MTTKRKKKVYAVRVIHSSRAAKPKGDGKKKRDAAPETIALDIDMPFVPTRGTMIRATPTGEYLSVTMVFWDASDPYSLLVFTEEPEPELLHSFARMRREGWHLADPVDLAKNRTRSTA